MATGMSDYISSGGQGYWGSPSIADEVYKETGGKYLHTNVDSFKFRVKQRSSQINLKFATTQIDMMIKEAKKNEEKIYRIFNVKNIQDLNEKYSKGLEVVKNNLIFLNLIDDFTKEFEKGLKIKLDDFGIERVSGGRQERYARPEEIRKNLKIQELFLNQKLKALDNFINNTRIKINSDHSTDNKESLKKLDELAKVMRDRIGLRITNMKKIKNKEDSNFSVDYTAFNETLSKSLRNITGYGNEFIKAEAIPIILNNLQNTLASNSNGKIKFSATRAGSSNDIEDVIIEFTIPSSNPLNSKKDNQEKSKIGISNKFASSGYKPIIKNPSINTLKNYLKNQKNKQATDFFEWYAANNAKFQSQGVSGFPSNLYYSMKSDGLLDKIFKPILMDLFTTSLISNSNLGGQVDFIMFNNVFLEKSKVLEGIKKYAMLDPKVVTRANIFEISIIQKKKIGGFDLPIAPGLKQGYKRKEQQLFSYDDSKLTGFSMIYSGWMGKEQLAKFLIEKYDSSLSTNIYLKLYIGELYDNAIGKVRGDGVKLKTNSEIFKLFNN